MYEDLNECMQKVSKGDKNAFRFIANYLGDNMYATASKLMGSQYLVEVDDAIQISLIKLWQSAPKWKKNGSVEGYVYRIVFSTCMDLHRKHKNNQVFRDNDLLSQTNLQNDLIKSEARGKILKAIEKLTNLQQQAIFLHYFRGYSQKEVSKLINKSEKGTESLIIRARNKLKIVLPENLKEEFFCA